MPRTRLQPDVQRSRILAAARVVFSDLGFARSTIGDIAREAGISRTLLYHYFSSKEEIFEALLLDATERMETMARNLRERGGTLEEQIRYLVDSYHEAMLSQPGLAKLLIDSTAAHRRPPMPVYQKRLRALRRSAVEWVESLGEDVRPAIPPEEFLLVALGALLAWFSPTPFAEALGARPGTQGKSLQRHKDAVVAILLHGIAAPPGAGHPAGAGQPLRGRSKGRTAGSQKPRSGSGPRAIGGGR